MKTILKKDSIFKIGQVISVEGRTIKVEVDKTKNNSHLLYDGELLRNIAVNSYIKILKGFTSIIGKVNGEFISEDKDYADKAYTSESKKIKRVLIVSLLGFFHEGKFERGIKELPLINNDCYLVDKTEFERIHNFVGAKDEALTIGTLTHEGGHEIAIGVNKLLASHIGIFGNTGSGKSYTLAKLYREVFKKYISHQSFKRNSQFFFIDFNGEYITEDAIIDHEYKNLYALNTRAVLHENKARDKFPVSYDAINNIEFWSIILEATEKTQIPFLNRSLKKTLDIDAINGEIYNLLKEIIVKGDKELGIKAILNLLWDLEPFVHNDNQVLFDLIKVCEGKLGTYNDGNFYLKGENSADKHSFDVFFESIKKITNKLALDLRNQLVELKFKIILNYYIETVRGFSNKEHLAPLLKRLENRFFDIEKVIEVKSDNEESDKNITIISLRDVNLEMRKVLPLLICKQLYEEKKRDNDKRKYLNIIVDEAHNILSSISDRESETWKDYRLETFEEIIKEGRKFGVFLTIASQRPFDISTTIISQLHKFFLHRLINDNDIKAVEKTVSYLDKISFESLPILPTGTCILAGLAAQIPVMLDISPIEDRKYEPDNKTMELIIHWEDDKNIES